MLTRLLLMSTLLFVTPAYGQALKSPPQLDKNFFQTIQKVEGMVRDARIQQMVRGHGLDIVNVTWEDTGRSKGSSVGPNISDMTIGVRDHNDAFHPMPVIRFDNFNDRTADAKTEKFFLLSGNERDLPLQPVSLSNILKRTQSFLHNPKSWTGKAKGLWDKRDTHVIVSAQACFLPIPSGGEATFAPVLYNYQSFPGNPAVATIVATREGTSIQVVENHSGYLSEVLYFNQDGQRAPLTATRISDFKKKSSGKVSKSQGVDDEAGLDVVMVIQVPLKHRTRYPKSFAKPKKSAAAEETMDSTMAMLDDTSDVEAAVISHGPVEGPFHEINGLAIERDHRFPVRVTVQFYKATSNGVIAERDIAEIRAQIDRVYQHGDSVGSLVTEGLTGRPTEWVPQPKEDATWAKPWWKWWKS
ncbi:MAG: hypothetical protein MK135_13725 [Polyangiaceae bacterium]|nr:hypothetical protein [Polyangiaceae bacterium]